MSTKKVSCRIGRTQTINFINKRGAQEMIPPAVDTGTQDGRRMLKTMNPSQLVLFPTSEHQLLDISIGIC
jgi:hypothetical protein